MPAPPSNRKSLRVAVAGGGIIGLSAALELRARGAEVAVYESGLELGAGATVRSAGMLGAAFACAGVAMLEAAWTRSTAATSGERGAGSLPLLGTWLGCVGVIAPIAVALAIAVAVGWRLVSPGRPASLTAWSAALRAEAQGHRADLAAFAL